MHFRILQLSRYPSTYSWPVQSKIPLFTTKTHFFAFKVFYDIYRCQFHLAQFPNQQIKPGQMAASYAYLTLYMFSFFFISIPSISIGSLIPFMAGDLGIDETEYSVIFVVMAVATFTAAIAYKLLGKFALQPKYHTMLIVCCLEIALFSVVFTFMKTMLLQCIVIAILKFFSYFFLVATNICLMVVPPKQDIALWMSFSHGAYGFGCLAGPLMVAFLEQRIFFVVAGACLMALPFFYFMTTPEDLEKSEEEQLAHKNSAEGSFRLELLVSFTLFVLIGVESTLNSWMPTYAVQTGIASKQGAVQYPSIFWTLESLFRFVFAYFPGRDSKKLTVFTCGQVVAGVVCVVMSVLHLTTASAYLSSVLYGFTLSMVFPLLLSISHEYGIHFSGDAVSNMMIFCTVSTGVYSTLTGELMKNTPEMYHYSMLGYSVILLVSFLITMHVLKAESQEAKMEKGLPLPVEE